jgi:hypothetical protein
LGFSGEWVFKHGKSPATIFITEEKSLHPGQKPVSKGLIVNMMGTGFFEQAGTSFMNGHHIPIHSYEAKKKLFHR